MSFISGFWSNDYKMKFSIKQPPKHLSQKML